jgi:GDP-4-dehydro-6-deoxy-D-mannose reductase
MRFLITGITGFAGPHLANLLVRNGHEVYGLVRCSNGRETDILDVVPSHIYKEITFVYGDLKDRSSLIRVFANNHFDGVFHLAAQSHPPTSFFDPIGTWETNVMGSMNLISMVEKTQCKLMFCSTSEVYGNTGRDGHLIRVGDSILPSNPYGASKAAIDLYMQERMNNGRLDGFITRAFSHTGPRRGKTFSISCDAFQLAQIALSGDKHSIRVGNLDTVRVVIDVRDTVEAYYNLMIHGGSSGKVYNVCGNIPRKMAYFTQKLIQIANMPDVETNVDPKLYRPIDIAYQHGDSYEVTKLTGWKPAIDIDETLKDLYNYWLTKIDPDRG